MSRDIPIIFSAPMVQALLAGRKAMTRRLAWGKPFSLYDDEDGRQATRMRDKGCKVSGPDDMGTRIGWPPSPWQKVKAGDRLWVRESLARSTEGHWGYSADGAVILLKRDDPRVNAMVAWAHHKELSYAPSIHMPRFASRLTLLVNDTKIERLTAMSEADAFAEGVEHRGERDYWAGQNRGTDAIGCFSALWISLHGMGSWNENPEVIALSLSVIKSNIDAPEARAA